MNFSHLSLDQSIVMKKMQQSTDFFCHEFTQHVHAFMKNHHLLNPFKKRLLSISVRGDSLCMFHLFSFSLSISESDFEQKARQKRSNHYFDFLNKNYWIYTVHHLDDSFELSLMQSFKQSSIKSTLGIPVFNRGIARPLLCVSKMQLKRFARAIGLNWLEDESNLNDHFEGNYTRQKIINGI